MPLVITKKKTVEIELPVEPLSEFAGLIDIVGALAAEAEEITARIKAEQEKLKPYKKALAELQEKIDGIEADDDATLEELGGVFRIEAGRKGTSRRIADTLKLRELMGDELFFQCASVTLKDIDAYLTAPQRAEVLEETRTGRTLKLIKRA
jgi:hypothetical protein